MTHHAKLTVNVQYTMEQLKDIYRRYWNLEADAYVTKKDLYEFLSERLENEIAKLENE